MSFVYVRLLTFLVLLPAVSGRAQWLSLPFERITIENGLPNPSVLDIIQDRQGFMWFGTLNGIVRYDGYQMTVYHPTAVEPDSLPERDVPRLYEDRAGNIWLGLMNQKAKLFRYNAHTDAFEPYLYNPSLPAEKQPIPYPICSFAEDNMGRLLVGTWDNGLYAINIPKEGVPSPTPLVKHFTHQHGDPYSLASDGLSEDMAVDNDGNIWIPTEGGLCKFIPGQDQFVSYTFTTDTTAGANTCLAVFFEAPRTLWVGTAYQGLLRFDTQSGRFDQQYKHNPADPFSIAGNWVGKVVRDRDGKLWVGTGQNYDIFDPVTQHFGHVKDRRNTGYTGNFPNNNALICDYSGNIWIATWQSGVYKYNPDKGLFYFLPPGFYQTNQPGKHLVESVWEDRHGYLWLGTAGDGLVRWDRKNNAFRHYRNQPGNPNSPSSNTIYGIAGDPDGTLWLATDTGLDHLDPETGAVRRFQPYSGKYAFVWRSRQGVLWAAVWGKGICRLADAKTGSFKLYPEWSNGTSGYPGLGSISTIEEDEAGKIYFGVNQWGFWRYDPDTDHFEHYLDKFGVHDIHFDRKGQCWLATHSGGLKLYDRQAQKIMPLPVETGIVRGILADHQGYLWMKTPTGILQFDPVKRQVLRQFSIINWMDSNKPWYDNAFCFQSQDGTFFYTSPSGLLYFRPDEIRTDTIPPKIAFTEFRLLNESVHPGEQTVLSQHISRTGHIRLAHWQNDFGIEFAALHFKSPEENRYSYILENYDTEWHDAGTQRVAWYTHISPGSYVFRVKATNCDGVEGVPIALSIVIRSPWWATEWAYLSYLLMALGLLLALRRYELNRQFAKTEARRLEELDVVKTRLYTNITHEFRTPLTIILGLAEQLKTEAGEGMKPRLDMIRRSGRQVLQLVNQMLDLAKAEAGHLHLDLVQGDVVNYLQYVMESFQSLAAAKKIGLQFRSGPDALFMDYDPERLQTVASNLLSNAIKFTPNGGTVTLRVEQIVDNKAPKLQLSVHDTGPGISEDKLPHVFDRFFQADGSMTRAAEGTGIGLTLTRELVKLMHGSIFAASELGKGATFTVLLPITRQAYIREEVTNSVRTESSVDIPTPANAVLPADKLRPPDAPKKPLVLVIEDNPDVVQYLYSCLHTKYHVKVAYDGELGIDKALELVPDLIISDVMMPRKDGFELCHILKTDERTSHIPIILLTARADIESRLTGLRRGADAYLAKPFYQEELLTRMHNLLDTRRKLHAHYLALAGLSGDSASETAVRLSADDAPDHAFVQKVKNLLEADISKQWSVSELARGLLVSESQLYRKLQALTGMNTTGFVRQVRLANARQLLRERPDEKVSAIAFEVGFPNVQEFGRRFKKAFGVTPGDWRRGG